MFMRRQEISFQPHNISPTRIDRLIGLKFSDLSKEELLGLLSASVQDALKLVGSGPFLNEDHLFMSLNAPLMKLALFSGIGEHFRIERFTYDFGETMEDGSVSLSIGAISPKWTEVNNGTEPMVIPLGSMTVSINSQTIR